VDVSLIIQNVLAWTQSFTWFLQTFAVVLVTLIVGFIVRRFVDHVSKRSRTTDTFIDDALFHALRGPSRSLVSVIGISLAAHIVSQETETTILGAIPIIRNIGVIAILAWFLIRFARSYEDHYVQQEQARGQKVDWTFIRAIGRIVRAAIFITATLVVLETLDISISGLLAFGGMGGIAVGLAARDILANVFGGLTIYLDRPFAVGDWIRSPDREIEGDVEEIGWRRTLIRTFDMRPLYVPNAVFTTISVENPSRMHNRRIFETIGVRYDDVNHMPAILADIREYLTTSPLIDSSRTLMVNFNQFGTSTLDFFIYCFTKTIVWTEYHSVKEEVLLKIADIVAQHGAEMAFPTSTIHVPHELQVTEKNSANE
jgi:MscS family membrane protein